MQESAVNEISDTIPKKFGKVAKLEVAYTESEAFKTFANQNKRVYSIAKKIEGLNKNTGVHPSGIAISFYELEDIMPVQMTGDDALVSGYDMNNVAELMVKFDILGLRTLSVVHDVCRQIGIKASDIDCNHPSIYAALQVLRSPSGLFQIEADTNFRVAQIVAPKNLEQLSAVVAIARPGALDFMDRYADYARNGEFQSVHPFFDDVLSYTGGIPLYQEQLMKMAVKVGFSLDESEQLRRIVGKKKVDQMAAWKEKISEKITENNLDPAIGDVLWKVAEDSANYSFNKCAHEDDAVFEEQKGIIKLKDVKVGDKVMSYDIDQDLNHFVPVLDVIVGTRELYEVTLEDGKVHRVSMDHKLLCEDLKMRPLREIIEKGYSIVTGL